MAKLPKEVEKAIGKSQRSTEVFDLELQRLMNEIEEELKNSPQEDMAPWEDNTPKNTKKVKELPEKKVKNKEKASVAPEKAKIPKKEPKEGETMITLKELSSELGMDAKKIRKWLRNNMEARSEGRWEWSANDPELDKIRKSIK